MNEEKQGREEENSSINIMELLYKMFEKWHLFVIAIVLAVVVCIFITNCLNHRINRSILD